MARVSFYTLFCGNQQEQEILLNYMYMKRSAAKVLVLVRNSKSFLDQILFEIPQASSAKVGMCPGNAFATIEECFSTSESSSLLLETMIGMYRFFTLDFNDDFVHAWKSKKKNQQNQHWKSTAKSLASKNSNK